MFAWHFDKFIGTVDDDEYVYEEWHQSARYRVVRVVAFNLEANRSAEKVKGLETVDEASPERVLFGLILISHISLIFYLI